MIALRHDEGVKILKNKRNTLFDRMYPKNNFPFISSQHFYYDQEQGCLMKKKKVSHEVLVAFIDFHRKKSL